MRMTGWMNGLTTLIIYYNPLTNPNIKQVERRENDIRQLQLGSIVMGDITEPLNFKTLIFNTE